MHLPPAEQAAKKARQGVRYGALEGLDVMDPETMAPVARDGEAMGEVMMRGNVVMKGYLKNKKSTDAAFAGGWFHTGDLGVMHPDGYIQLKDRSKDIIISGGENISSIEVEDALVQASGRRRGGRGGEARRQMGRDALRLHRIEAGRASDRGRPHRVVQQESRRLQGAAHYRVRRDPEDEHGEDPEVQAARDGEGGSSRYFFSAGLAFFNSAISPFAFASASFTAARSDLHRRHIRLQRRVFLRRRGALRSRAAGELHQLLLEIFDIGLKAAGAARHVLLGGADFEPANVLRDRDGRQQQHYGEEACPHRCTPTSRTSGHQVSVSFLIKAAVSAGVRYCG